MTCIATCKVSGSIDRWSRRQIEGAIAAAAPGSLLVLDVDSPGGTASDAASIMRTIERARGSGVRVVAVANTTATSAAHAIALCCDKVYAVSCGVVGGLGITHAIYDDSDAMKKAGVENKSIAIGSRKLMFASGAVVAKEDVDMLGLMMRSTWESTLKIISRCRPAFSRDIVTERDGAVMTAEQALGDGLVDEVVGSFADAVEAEAKEAAVDKTEMVTPGAEQADVEDTEVAADEVEVVQATSAVKQEAVKGGDVAAQAVASAAELATIAGEDAEWLRAAAPLGLTVQQARENRLAYLEDKFKKTESRGATVRPTAKTAGTRPSSFAQAVASIMSAEKCDVAEASRRAGKRYPELARIPT